MKTKNRRSTSHAIMVYCTPDEKESIKRQAKKAGLSVSTYLRKVGQGYPITGVIDLQAVQTLAKVNGDLGRMGGLLKLWLTNDEKVATVGRNAILAALGRIQSTQSKMNEIMETVVSKHRNYDDRAD